MVLSLAACGNEGTTSEEPTSEVSEESPSEETPAVETEDSTETAGSEEAAGGVPTYSQITLGEDYTDLTATIAWVTHKTDREEDGTLEKLITAFNADYPNITVDWDAIPDYAEEALLRISTGDYPDVMSIPAIDKNELATYYMPFDTLENMQKEINFAEAWSYDGMSYGVPFMANAQGIVYNKAVFEAAGITELPKTPDEFIADLQAIKDNTDAIPLYTNYAAGWTMGAWDAYVGTVSNGDDTYMNQKLVHTADPFKNNGDGTGAYAVYKILYDAVANGLIEDDYSTTDWEGCKGMINRGEIGCMVLGSWAYAQMVEAGDHGDDIGYMPFPITVNGQQWVTAGGDYNYCINVNSSDENKTAAMVFVKWMTEKSGWCYLEGGYTVAKDGENPDMYSAFDGCVVSSDQSALEGEATLLDDMNAESELMINAGGNAKVQRIVEAAATGSESFDDIMADWTAEWNNAQESLGIEVLY